MTEGCIVPNLYVPSSSGPFCVNPLQMSSSLNSLVLFSLVVKFAIPLSLGETSQHMMNLHTVTSPNNCLEAIIKNISILPPGFKQLQHPCINPICLGFSIHIFLIGFDPLKPTPPIWCVICLCLTPPLFMLASPFPVPVP